jgi:hypothetical protein
MDWSHSHLRCHAGLFVSKDKERQFSTMSRWKRVWIKVTRAFIRAFQAFPRGSGADTRKQFGDVHAHCWQCGALKEGAFGDAKLRLIAAG